jgi:hypothetical protein
MRLACRKRRVPFLVLMREHHLTPDQTPHQELYRRARSCPQVDGIAVAGDATIAFIDGNKLQPREILRSTGFPRFDVWAMDNKPSYDSPVVLMSYRKGYGADGHFVEMLERFAAAARRHPAVPFLVKAKHRPEVGVIEQMLPERSDNLKVVDALVLPRLIANARAIIGFRSISLYECLLSGAPVLIPYWGETAMHPLRLAPSPADVQLRGFMEFIPDPAAFDLALDRAASTPRPPAAAMDRFHDIFARYFRHDPRQLATTRVEDFVAEFAHAQ